MSLINEALRRAREEGSRLCRPGRPGGAGPHARADLAEGQPAGGRRSDLARAVMLGIPVVAVVVLLTYSTLPTEEKTPRPAAAENPDATANPEPFAQAGQDSGEGTTTTEDAAAGLKGPGWPEQLQLGWAPTTSPSGRATSPAVPIWPAPVDGAAHAPADGQGRESPSPQFKLGGILRSAGTARAVVNGQMVVVGDEIDGAQVVSISRSQVVLEKDGSQIVLRVR